MAEVTVSLEDVLSRTSKTKLVLLSGTPTATNDVITCTFTTSGGVFNAVEGYSKVLTAQAYDSSTGMPKAISHNGSTVLTTVGWVVGDNKWFIYLVLKNDQGEVA